MPIVQINTTSVQSDETNVNWMVDGEFADDVVINRPIKEVATIVNDVITSVNGLEAGSFDLVDSVTSDSVSTASTSNSTKIAYDKGVEALNAANNAQNKASDADFLDGLDSTQFLRSDTSDSMTGTLTTTGDLIAGQSGRVEVGRGSGALALTINDGYGNTNIAFNHSIGIPDQDGNAGRISVNTDATSAAEMIFSLKNNVTSGVQIPTLDIMSIKGDGVEVYGDVTATNFIGSADDSKLLDGLDSTQFIRNDVANQTIYKANTDNSLNVVADNNYEASINALGSSQGTGILYTGQDNSHGGGIFYNGDVSPAYATNEVSDHVSFFRRENNINEVVFGYRYSSSDVYFNGDITASTLNGNATSATKLNTARTISLSGDASGSVSFDGTSNVSIPVVIADDSHNHDSRYFTETQADARYLGINAKADDSELLDGLNSTQYLRSDIENASGLFQNITLDDKIASTGDTHTYLQFHGEDRYRVVTGGNERFEVTNNTTTVSNDLVVAGDLTVNGETTQLNTTVTTLDDPIITLADNTSIDDNKDRGVEFKWHDGSGVKTGFFGYNDSAERFSFIKDGTNTSEVFDGTLGDAEFSTVYADLSGTASNAALLDGYDSSQSGVANTVAVRDSGGDLRARLHRSEYNDSSSISGGMVFRVNNGSDNYLRTCNDVGAIRTFIDTFSKAESNSNYLFKTDNAVSATKLNTARTIALNGDASGSISFDGSSNQTITVVIANDSHTHDTRYFTESQADARYLGISSKASDSNLLDGVNSTSFLRSDQSDTMSGNLQVNGDITASGNITAYSDSRLKKEILRIPNALEKVCSVSGYTYERIDIEDQKQTGVIAQEILEVLPEAVTGGPTEENPDGHYAVAYGNMVGLLIESIKDLSDENDQKQKQLDDQEKRLIKLEKRFEELEE